MNMVIYTYRECQGMSNILAILLVHELAKCLRSIFLIRESYFECFNLLASYVHCTAGLVVGYFERDVFCQLFTV